MRLAALLFLLVAAAATAGEPAGRLSSGTVTLFDSFRHQDIERATFSFEVGLRDDPGRWDWELSFGGDKFQVNTNTEDRSRIVDVGKKTFVELDALPALPPFDRKTGDRVAAVAGHLYFVHTRDRNSDHLSAFRVAELVPGDRCTIEWIHWQQAKPRKKLALDAETKARLARLLDGAAAREREAERLRRDYIQDPANLILQIRTGAQGGNSSRLTLIGMPHRLPDRPAAEALDMTATPTSKNEPQWYLAGGHIPVGKALLIQAIDVFARAPGDNNGHGEVQVRIGSQRLFEVRDDAGPYQVWHEGAVVLLPGDEERIVVEAANSSAVEVRLVGLFVDPKEAERIPRRPFEPAQAPARAERAGGVIPRAHRGILLEPRVVLHLRAGAGGGNPNRVSMLGKASPYVDRMSDRPLLFEEPVTARDDAVGYAKGGKIPHGKIFVVRRITYEGTATGDSNGHGEFILKILKETIHSARDTKQPIRGVWTGSIELRPGQEKRVFLEVANSSTGRVTIEGDFVDDK